jgi:hypothetical protein
MVKINAISEFELNAVKRFILYDLISTSNEREKKFLLFLLNDDLRNGKKEKMLSFTFLLKNTHSNYSIADIFRSFVTSPTRRRINVVAADPYILQNAKE